jgi:protein-tyrosine kinase
MSSDEPSTRRGGSLAERAGERLGLAAYTTPANSEPPDTPSEAGAPASAPEVENTAARPPGPPAARPRARASVREPGTDWQGPPPGSVARLVGAAAVSKSPGRAQGLTAMPAPGARGTPGGRPLPPHVNEQFRQVKNQLLQNAMARGAELGKRRNLILVASARQGEGRTFCAVNLALAVAAERDLSVLLVDADVGHPDILVRLGMADAGGASRGKGLLTLVSDPTADFADCVVRTGVENLSVLPPGRHKELTTELFVSERMAALTAEIAQRYIDRIVIFDTPPALASPIPSILAPQVGQALVVVAAERTAAGDVAKALAQLEPCDKAQLLLNRARVRTRL